VRLLVVVFELVAFAPVVVGAFEVTFAGAFTLV